jgi:CheY-like chemotaxis protein
MDIPVIAQTAYAMTDDPSKILEAGCDDYISKPIHRKNLLARIAFYLTKKSGPKAD